MYNINDFGFISGMNPDNKSGTPARITAVHKGRFGIVSEFGEGYASLKSKEYYYDGEAFPTVGDFVMIDYVENGDSRITATLDRKTYFSRRDPDKGRVNTLAGEDIMDTNGIREDDSKGRHTTTHRELIMLKSGVMIIDTPGMRELGMWDVTEGLGEAFADVEQFIVKCRFRDCKHENEPGCAVREAIEKGDLDPKRFESYKKIKSEAKFADDKTDFLKQKQQWGKNLRKYEKHMKKEIW